MSRRIVDHERREALRGARELAGLVLAFKTGDAITLSMHDAAAIIRHRLAVADRAVDRAAAAKRKRRKAVRRG